VQGILGKEGRGRGGGGKAVRFELHMISTTSETCGSTVCAQAVCWYPADPTTTPAAMPFVLLHLYGPMYGGTCPSSIIRTRTPDNTAQGNTQETARELRPA
jgi:hypothetical protein